MWYRYSHWDGSQRLPRLDPRSVMDSMADGLIQGGDLMRALRSILQKGMQDPGGESIKGIQSLLEKLRRLKKRDMERYNLDTSLRELKDKLENIIEKERNTLEEGLNRDGPEGDRSSDTSTRAQNKLDYLDSLPEDVGRRIEALRGYDFVDREAGEEFRRLLEMLQQKALDTFFQNMKTQFEEMTWEKARQLKDMLRDLNKMFEERARGGKPDLKEFMDKHGGHLGNPDIEDFEQLIDSMQRNMGRMASLVESMSHDMKNELSRMLQSSIFDEDFRGELQDLTEHLRSEPGFAQLVSRYPFKGEEELSLDEALKLMEKFQEMEGLERSLQQAWRSGRTEDVDEEKLRELLGEESLRELKKLKGVVDLLEEAGYIRKSGDELRLTPKGIKKIGLKAMGDIFASLKRSHTGEHAVGFAGKGGNPIEETKEYEFGDHFSVNVGRTLMNAMIRDGGCSGDIQVKPEDFEVYRNEYLSHTSTVIMIDMSGSMETFDRFSAAKKVAIAMESLIRTQFPRDTLYIVGFYTHAREIKKEELPFINPKPFGYNPYMPVDLVSMQWGYLNLEIDHRDIDGQYSNVPESFTNIQQGLLCSARLLARENCPNKQIIMITDGEPTAHSQEGRLYLQYPPSRQTIRETLKEVERCTRRGITINTFMLNRDYFLEKFVDQITRINRGRAFFTSPDKIGEYIFVDYLRNKRGKIARA